MQPDSILYPYIKRGTIYYPHHRIGGFGFMFAGYVTFRKDEERFHLGYYDYTDKSFVIDLVKALKSDILEQAELFELIMLAGFHGKTKIVNFFENYNMVSLRVNNITDEMLNLFTFYFRGRKDLADELLSAWSKNKRRKFERTFRIKEHNYKHLLKEDVYHYITLKLYNKISIVIAGDFKKSYSMILKKFPEYFSDNEKKLMQAILSSE